MKLYLSIFTVITNRGYNELFFVSPVEFAITEFDCNSSSRVPNLTILSLKFVKNMRFPLIFVALTYSVKLDYNELYTTMFAITVNVYVILM